MTAPVVIAGAGIAGLTAALAFAARGIAVALHERAPEASELGAGLQLSPNASRILQRLGALDALRPLAVAPRRLAIMALDSARPIASMPLGNVAEQRYGAPYLVARRADLHRVLLERIRAEPLIRLTVASRLVGVEEKPDVTVATLESLTGTRLRVETPLLVGADGLWSATRRLLGDNTQPDFSGRIAYRGTIAAESVAGQFSADEVAAFLGARAHLILYPIAGGTRLNIVLILDAADPGTGWTDEISTNALLARLPTMAPRLKTLIAGAPKYGCWPLSTRSVWFGSEAGRAILIGDAAHPVVPFLAQGAAMGIEDGDALAEIWSEADDPRQAFSRFVAARARRVARVQAMSFSNGRVFHLRGPARFARDLVLRALSGERMLARYDWLYGHGR